MGRLALCRAVTNGMIIIGAQHRRRLCKPPWDEDPCSSTMARSSMEQVQIVQPTNGDGDCGSHSVSAGCGNMKINFSPYLQQWLAICPRRLRSFWATSCTI